MTVLSETSKISDGIVRALREVDPKAREAGRRWAREIETGMGSPKVQLDADTTKAKKEIEKVEKAATQPKSRSTSTRQASPKPAPNQNRQHLPSRRYCCSTDTLADEWICNQSVVTEET